MPEKEDRHSDSKANWQERINIACESACRAIAPTWPLDRAIAVNPYWQRINRPLREVAARMATLGNISVFPVRSYIKQAWDTGRIKPVDLDYALSNLAEAKAQLPSADDCINALKTPMALPRLPLLIDILDDDPEQHTRLSWRQAITQQVSQTCASYFDTDQADWQPDRKEGLYAFWRDTLTHDNGIGTLMGLPDLAKQLHFLPETATDSENWVLQRLGLPETVWADYLEAVLLTVNGWASWCAYLGWQAAFEGKTDNHLRELLAIRLAWGVILLQCKDEMAISSTLSTLQNKWTHAERTIHEAEEALLVDEAWQLALETGYQNRLADDLLKKSLLVSDDLPEVQAAFCIDVRSEPIRRSLEHAHPKVQTIGFAGFFGLPVAYSPLGTKIKRPQLPGLLAPTMVVSETVYNVNNDEKESNLLTKTVTQLRHNHLKRLATWEAGSLWPSAAFSFVEAAGLTYLGKLKQWVHPTQNTRENSDQYGIPKRYREVTRPILTIDIESKVDLAAQVLVALGLNKQLAPLVLLVGHGSQSENNAQSAALDCGACCGQTGEVNARVLANILNDDIVREKLRRIDINIPANTAFVASLHNTTTDEVEPFDLDLLSPDKQAMWQQFMPTLNIAGDMVRRERAESLGINPQQEARALLKAMRQRANDGAQTRPEWGLAGNAAFIISPRHRTKNHTLNGRSFLHDYAPEKDVDGSLLEQLMTAPMLVTHWINWQYHSSACDQLHMGSGNKVLHNVVGCHLGVFEGNSGDLRIGLSKQSLFNGDQLVHEPLRLTVVIDASAELIERIMHKHAVVKQLVDHGWLHLWRFEGATFQRYSHGQWQKLNFD